MSDQAAPPKRRPRRIAADEAHSWARNLRLGNSHAKTVLSMLTLYVNGDGVCFVGIGEGEKAEGLAWDCELSPDTVRKRLAWLEQIGAIVRLPQWIDASGRRNGEGRGKRTSDEIRLLIHADPDEIERRAKGDDDPPDREGAAEISPRYQQGLNPELETGQPPVSPRLAPDQPSESSEGLDSSNLNLEPESPPNPPPGGVFEAGDEVDQGKRARKRSSWQKFEAAWKEPILRQTEAQQVWQVLTEVEEVLATTAARGYVVWRAKQVKPPNAIGAHKFLKETDAWASFAALAPPELVPVAPPVFIVKGSPEWQARRVIAALLGSPVPIAHQDDDGLGDWRPSNLSPQWAGLAVFAPAEDGEIDTSKWLIVETGTQACGAWRNFAKVEPTRIWTGETREERIGTQIYPNWRVTVSGLRVPCKWPPLKDGSISPSGPRDAISDEDAAALTGEP